MFSFPRNQGFKWQMIKQDWTKIEAADQQITTDSSVGRAEDCRKADILRSLVRGRVGGWHEKVFFETKLNEHFRRSFFEDPEQISLIVWTDDQKEQKKNKKIFCLFFFHLVNKVFRWKMIKQSPENTSADSSVGRAEDCRKTDILRSLVRVRVGGWHEKFFFETKFNEHFRRSFFEDPEQFSLFVWTNDQKEQENKKIFI